MKIEIFDKILKIYNGQRRQLGLTTQSAEARDKQTTLASKGILVSALFDIYVNSQIALHYDVLEKLELDNKTPDASRGSASPVIYCQNGESLDILVGKYFNARSSSKALYLILPYLLGETLKKEYTEKEDSSLWNRIRNFFAPVYQPLRRVFRVGHNLVKLFTMVPLRIIDFGAQVRMENFFSEANELFHKANESNNLWEILAYGIGGLILSGRGTAWALIHGAAKLSFLVTRAALSPKESFNKAYHIHPVLGAVSMITTIVTQALIVGPFALVGAAAVGIGGLSASGAAISSGLSGLGITQSLITATTWVSTHFGFNGLTAAQSLIGFTTGVALSIMSTLPTFYSRMKQSILSLRRSNSSTGSRSLSEEGRQGADDENLRVQLNGESSSGIFRSLSLRRSNLSTGSRSLSEEGRQGADDENLRVPSNGESSTDIFRSLIRSYSFRPSRCFSEENMLRDHETATALLDANNLGETGLKSTPSTSSETLADDDHGTDDDHSTSSTKVVTGSLKL